MLTAALAAASPLRPTPLVCGLQGVFAGTEAAGLGLKSAKEQGIDKGGRTGHCYTN